MTIYDIAEVAGVSASTVSRVINDKPGIKESTRQKVKALLKEYNYSPNEAARGLVKQSSRMIGILIEDIRVAHHTEAVYVIEQELTARGYTCVTLSTGHGAEKAEAIQILEQRRVEGVILIGSMFGMKEVESSIREHLRDIPVVIVNGKLDLDHGYGVLVDEEEGMEQCVRFLVEKGCRQLAFVMDVWTPSNQNKMQGFCKEMERQGVTDIKEKIFYASDDDKTDPKSAMEKGRTITREILEKNSSVDGIIYAVDLFAVGGMQELKSRNISVPEQVMVMGVDNTLYGTICEPTLTTLDNKLVDLSQNAAEILLNVLEGNEINLNRILSAEIIERESTR